jgi:hypothetical protein
MSLKRIAEMLDDGISTKAGSQLFSGTLILAYAALDTWIVGSVLDVYSGVNPRLSVIVILPTDRRPDVAS